MLTSVEDGKLYYLSTGEHAAIIRKSESGFKYLELQKDPEFNGWYRLDDQSLEVRFGCLDHHEDMGVNGYSYNVLSILFDISKLKGNVDFEEILSYINTNSIR